MHSTLGGGTQLDAGSLVLGALDASLGHDCMTDRHLYGDGEPRLRSRQLSRPSAQPTCAPTMCCVCTSMATGPIISGSRSDPGDKTAHGCRERSVHMVAASFGTVDCGPTWNRSVSRLVRAAPPHTRPGSGRSLRMHLGVRTYRTRSRKLMWLMPHSFRSPLPESH
ncbi:hypothetical protein LZ30DRAFT_3508 [Colletotrichum cereale]|nr:hypothetical protein LZ30DRAFT_3508 [Colletotrichum cereale]